jgi:hypothetical protein
MVSAWWLLLAFFGGGCAGILAVALMRMSGELPEPSPNVPDLNTQPW